MAKVLKVAFNIGADKTSTLSISEPKDSLSKSEVQAWADNVVAKQALMVGGQAVTAVKDMYIQETTRTELT